jgi:probable rRNA maturation factor
MIYFTNEQERYPIGYSLKMLIRRAVLASLEYEGFGADTEVSVTFTDNEGIRAINSEFRGIDAPTDVLSFPLTDYEAVDFPVADEPAASLGDIVLSLERADEQAREFGHSFEREVAFLTVHSMLHLLGYDHVNSDEEDAEMRRRQREILESMGLGVK